MKHLGLILACAALVAGCGKKDAKKDDGPKESEMAKSAMEDIAEMKAEMEKGEDIKYGCAGNLGKYASMKDSKDASEKKAWAALAAICHVDLPKKQIADLRAKIKSGELDTFDTMELTTTLKSIGEGGDKAVAADAKKLLEVEIPTYQLKKDFADAMKEKEAGETVSMGCIKAHQTLKKHQKSLEADADAKKLVDEVLALCPKK